LKVVNRRVTREKVEHPCLSKALSATGRKVNLKRET
jgi:hypothetical protein